MEMIDTLFPVEPASESDVRRWIKSAREEGAAAERARIRRELLGWKREALWFDPVSASHQLNARDFTTALDRICPEEG